MGTSKIMTIIKSLTKKEISALISLLSKKRRRGFEIEIIGSLRDNNIQFDYEAEKLGYVIPESFHRYTPDFRLEGKNGIIYIETKGKLTPIECKKHLLVKAQHEDIDLRFIFSNANKKLRKGSQTTYGMWAEKHGFKYAHKIIPEEWLEECLK